jgi:iron complex outermembrane receptor protein
MKFVTKILVILILCLITFTFSELFSQETNVIYLSEFKPYKTDPNKQLKEKISNTFTDKLTKLKTKIKKTNTIDEAFSLSEKGEHSVVIGGYYRLDKHDQLSIYGQIYHSDEKIVIDAFNFTHGVAGFDPGLIDKLKLDSAEIKISQDEIIQQFTEKMIQMIHANPNRGYKRFNIEEFITKSVIGKDINFPIKKAIDAEVLSADVFKFLAEEMIVITATKSAKKIEETPSIASVISARQIRAFNIRTLYDLLRIIPGLNPIRLPGGIRSVVVRGALLKDGILVLLDGIPLNDPVDGTFSFFDRPLQDVQRIEIIRGPGSALYGGYALVAVINIITNQGKNINGIEAGLIPGFYENSSKFYTDGYASFGKIFKLGNKNQFDIAGSFQYRDSDGDKYHIIEDSMTLAVEDRGNFDALAPSNRFLPNRFITGNINLKAFNFESKTLIASKSESPIFSYFNSLPIKDNSFERKDFLIKTSLGYRITDIGMFSFLPKVFMVINQRETRGNLTGPMDTSPSGTQTAALTSWEDGKIQNRQHKATTLGGELQTDYEVIKNKNIATLGLAAEKTNLGDVENAQNFKNAEKDKNIIRVGEVGAEPTIMTDEQPWMPTKIDRTILSAYLQDLWDMTSFFSLTLGARFDRFIEPHPEKPKAKAKEYNTMNLRGATLVKILESKTNIKLMYGQAFKPPTFETLYDVNENEVAGETRRQGNPNLEPTTIQTFESGIYQMLEKMWNLNLALFYLTTEKEINFNNHPTVRKWQNKGDRSAWGFEFECIFTYKTSYEAFFNYSFQQNDVKFTGVGANIYPEHGVNIGTNIGFLKYYYFHFYGSIRSSPLREKADLRKKIPAIYLFNTGVSTRDWLYKNLELSFFVYNIFDQRYRTPLSSIFVIKDDMPEERRFFALKAIYFLGLD